jgi:hypothetical protein
MPRVPYKQFAINIGENYPNFRREKGEDDFSFVQRFVADVPEYRNWVDYTDESTLENPNPVKPSVNRKGISEPTQAKALGQNLNLFQGATDIPPYLLEKQKPLRSFQDEVGEKYRYQTVDAVIDFANKSRKTGSPKINEETIGFDDIYKFVRSNAVKGNLGSDAPSIKIGNIEAANELLLRAKEKAVKKAYGENADLDYILKEADPLESSYVDALSRSKSLKLMAEQYRAAGYQDVYNDFSNQANTLESYANALGSDPDFQKKIDIKNKYIPQFQRAQKESQRLADDIKTTALLKKLDSDINVMVMPGLKYGREAIRDYIGGTSYWISDLFGSDRAKSFIQNNPYLSSDPMFADEEFGAPAEPGKPFNWDKVPGFMYKQTINMLPALAAGFFTGGASTVARAGAISEAAAGLGLGLESVATAKNVLNTIKFGSRAAGVAVTYYDDAIRELDQAAANSGVQVNPSQKSVLAALATAKTAAIESLNPLDEVLRTNVLKGFAKSAMSALATGKGFRSAMYNGANSLLYATKVYGLETGEELLDETVQRGLNAISNEALGLNKTDSELPDSIPTLGEYGNIALNTLVATVPFMGAGTYAASSNFKNDVFHSVSRQGLAEDFVAKIEENRDNIGFKKANLLSNELQRVNNVYKGIPQEYDEDAARAIADKSLQIDALNEKIKGAPSEVIRKRLTDEKKALEDDILVIEQQQQGALSKGIEPPVYNPQAEVKAPASDIEGDYAPVLGVEDDYVLNLVEQRIEPIMNPLAERMRNAEEIDVAEIEDVASKMIDAVGDGNFNSPSLGLNKDEKKIIVDLVSSQIDNLLNYEFATTTTTEQTGKARQVKGVVRTAKPGLPQKISTDRFLGTPVTNPQTGEKGFFVLNKVPITQSRTGLKYQFVSEAEMKRQENGEYKARQGTLKLGDDVAPSTPFTNMEYVSSNFGEDGNLTSVVLRDAQSGNELQIDDQELALDIAIAESQRQIGTVPEGAFISTIQRVIPVEQRVKIFPNLRETGTTPAAVGVQPQTEQDVRQETDAAQEGRAQGEDAAPVPQEEGRQEGQVAPKAVVQEGGTPPPTEQKTPTTEEAIKGMAKSAKSAESLARELEKALNAMKVKVDKNAAREGTFMIPALVYNGAIDAAILAVKAGKTVADAVNVAVKYINEKFDGEWDKGGFLERLSVDLTKPMESYSEYQDKKAKGKQPVVGQKVGVRFNLGVRDYGRRVVSSIHDKSFNGEVIDIVKAATVNDVKFSASKSSAKKIKEGESTKFPMASVDGSFVSNDVDKSVIENGQRVFFDPKITDFFYDKDGREVLSASRATVDGSKYFAEGLKYGDRVVDLTQQQAQAPIESGDNVGLSRRLSGNALLNAQDLLDELSNNGADIDEEGNVTVYHRTSPEKKEQIEESGKMTGLENGVFFSTRETGQAEGYGNAIVKLKVPVEKLQIDDVFGNEAHVRIPTSRAGQKIDVLSYLKPSETQQQAQAETKPPRKAKTVFHAGTLDGKGNIYVSPIREQANEYSSMSGAPVLEFEVNEDAMAPESEVRDLIGSLDLKLPEGYNLDELFLYEALDTRVKSSLSQGDIDKLYTALKDKGYEGIAFRDEDIRGVKREGIDNFIVFDKSSLSEQQAQPEAQVEATAKALKKAVKDNPAKIVQEENGFRITGGIFDIQLAAREADKIQDVKTPSSLSFLPKTLTLSHLARSKKDKNSILKNGFDIKQASIDSPIKGTYFSSEDWSTMDRFGRVKEDSLYVDIDNDGLLYFDSLGSLVDYLKSNNFPYEGQTLTDSQMQKLKDNGVKGILLREDFASQSRNELIVIDDSIIKNISESPKDITKLPSSFSNIKEIAEAYHKAKADGSGQKLVQAVEGLLGQTTPEVQPEKPTAEQRKEGVKSAAQKVAKSFSNWITGGGNKLGIANLPEQDAERFAQLVKDIGVLAEALVENGMTRAETALRAIKPYFETNYSEWLRLANVYFKSEFNLALIQKYPEVYKRGQKLQKEFDKTLKQRDALLAKDIEEAKAEIIGKIKSRLNPSNWATKTKAKLAKARLTSESISDLKAYSKLFTDEDLSEMDPKMLKELYKEVDQIYKSGRRSQIANNKVLNEQARNLRQRSVISVGKSLGLTESVSSYEIAKKKAQRPGVRFYIMLNSDPNVIQDVDRKDIDSWKDFFGAKGFTTIAIDVNANTSSKQKGLLGKLRSGINMIAINNFFDTRNIMALLANDEDAFNMFEKNFIDLIYKSDFERDELKNTIGRFDSIAQKLKKSGYDIGKKQKSIVLRLGDNNAEGTNSDGLTIGQIIDVFMMLRDPDALVRSGGEGLVNYNQEDIDKIIDYVLSNKPVLDAVEEVTAKYQDVLQEHVLPTLSTFGYDLEKFNTRTYNTNGSFSKNDVENARAIEILNKVYSNNIPQSVPYSPLSVFSGEEMIGKDYDVTNPGNEEKVVSVLSNNVISRIDGGQLQFGNVANKYNNYMNGMIDMVTRMPVLHNAQAIFNKDVSRLIENKLGESATKAIRNNINRVVSNRLKVSEEESMINPAMSNWLNRAVLGQMFLNTRSAAFQPIALLNYAAVAPDLEEYAKSTSRMLSPINFAETAKEISNQAWIKERFGGKIFSIDAKELDERTKNDQPSYWTVIDQLLKAGYTLTAAGDIASILVGGSPLYDSVKNKKYNEYIKTMSKKDAEAQSIKDASLALYKATNESQQSSNNLLISNSQKNPAIRFFLSFTTANQQLLRRALLAGQMMKLGVGSPQRNAYTILQFGMINAALFTLISRTPELLFGLFDDDEEDLKKKERKDALKNKYVDDVIGGLMSGLGAPGVLLYNSIRGLIPDAVGEEKFDKVTNPEMFYMFSNNLSKSISSSAPAFSIKLRQIEDAIEAAEKGEYAKSLANAISFGSGIPTARAYDLFGQATEASVRDYTGMERFLRATDIYNKGWAQKHYEEQVLRGKTPALSKIEEKEIKDKNTRELNELMRDLGFRAASKNEAGLKADLEKVKKYSEYAAKNYSLTSDQYETLVENFNRGYFAGTLPKEFVDYGRMSSQTRVEAIAKKINSFENDLERQEYLLKLDSANANQTLFSAGEVKRIKELIE